MPSFADASFAPLSIELSVPYHRYTPHADDKASSMNTIAEVGFVELELDDGGDELIGISGF